MNKISLLKAYEILKTKKDILNSNEHLALACLGTYFRVGYFRDQGHWKDLQQLIKYLNKRKIIEEIITENVG